MKNLEYYCKKNPKINLKELSDNTLKEIIGGKKAESHLSSFGKAISNFLA